MWLRAPVGCLLERPATRRAQIKVRQELGRPVERSVVQRNDGHPAVVDLFPQHRDFLLQPVVLRLQSHAYVNTVSRLTAGGTVAYWDKEITCKTAERMRVGQPFGTVEFARFPSHGLPSPSRRRAV